MVFWLGLVIGAGLGHTLRHRRDWQTRLVRKIQLIAVMRELKGYRLKGNRPAFPNWAKFWLGWLYIQSPTLTRYLTVTPATLIRWHRTFCKQWWAWKSRSHQCGVKRGRPRLPENLAALVCAIHADNPRYGHRKIAAILMSQLGMRVSETKVRNILAARRDDSTPPPSGQNWNTFLRNHRLEIAAMDFKTTFDWRGRQVFILNIIDHVRRKLLWSRASYYPTGEWVSQQLREAFGWDAIPKYMVIDNDTIFQPAAWLTLPNMKVEVIRTSFKSPWQNGVVERFNRTLNEELLEHIIRLGEKHLNKLLARYRDYYNHGRPHQANRGQSPVIAQAANDDAINFVENRVEKIPWLNGLHHSYRLAA